MQIGGLSPELYVSAIDGRASRLETPCGDGTMVWRAWGDGWPLVLLHGGYGSWLHWLRNVRDLSKHYRVLVPDLPGNGESALPPLPMTPEGMARILADGLDSIIGEEARFDIVGFSFGGIVGGHLAAQSGERVATLVLSGPNGMSLSYPPLPRLERVSPEMTEEEAAEANRHNAAALMLADPDRADAVAVYVQGETTRQARVDIKGIPESDSLLQVLPQVRARICAFWGERDAFTGPYLEERRDLLARFQPDLDFRIIPGAGHWCAFESPGAVNATILEMLGEGG